MPSRAIFRLGEIVAFANYLLTTISPLTIMAMIATNLANGPASAQRVNQILDTVPEVQDQPQGLPCPPPCGDG